MKSYGANRYLTTEPAILAEGLCILHFHNQVWPVASHVKVFESGRIGDRPHGRHRNQMKWSEILKATTWRRFGQRVDVQGDVSIESFDGNLVGACALQSHARVAHFGQFDVSTQEGG